MKKRILSITLVLAMIISLFAVANFGAVAKTELSAGTDYTISGFNTNAEFNLDPKDNLLNNVPADNLYWYNADERDVADTYTYRTEPTLVTDTGWFANMGLATIETNTPTAVQPAFQMCGYLSYKVFLHYGADNKVETVDAPNEDMQWVQTNYTLPTRSTITDITLSTYSATNTLSLNAPTAYQYIFSDTPGGLVSGIGATVVEVNHTAATIKNFTTVTLNKPVTAKYMAIRMLQPYNIVNCSTSMVGKSLTSRWYNWNRLDVHGTPADEVPYTISGTNNTNDVSASYDASKNLLNDVAPIGAYFYNEDASDPAAVVTQNGYASADKYLVNQTLATASTNTPSTKQDGWLMGNNDIVRNMFVKISGQGTSTAKVESLDAPSDKQWVQINYALPEKAKITDAVLSCWRQTSDVVDGWTPQSYQWIFANTLAELMTDKATVITVDHTADTIKNITTATLKTPVTAKYVAIRFYQPYNNFTTVNNTKPTSWSAAVINSNLWFRFNKIDIHGEFTPDPFTISGVNNRGNSPVDITKNLLSDIIPDDFYWVNTDTTDPEDVVALTPTKIPDNQIATEHIDHATSSANTITANEPAFWLKANSNFMRKMFIKLEGSSSSDAKITAIDTPDVNKQWVQANYTLAAEAKISDIVLSYNGNTNETLSGWAPQSYQYIFANTKDGLISGEGATVITVDHTADTIKNISKVTMKDGKEITAKYFAVRLLQPYNQFATASGNAGAVTNWSGAVVWSNFWYRFSRIDLNGAYINPVDAEVTANTEEGVPSTLISKADAVYTGPKDNNGNYSAGSVKVTATETYEDKANLKLYTFKGWYNGETIVSANAEYTYDLTKGDITLTAKYDVEETTVKYTLTFVDASKTVVGTIVVEEGKTVDMALVNAIVVKDIYGYTVKREGGNVVWDNGFDEPVIGDKTYNAQYEAIEELKTTVTVYDVDGSKYIDNREIRFDSQINLVSTKGAEYWADAAGNVLVGAPTGKLYACGTTMEIYAKTGEFETPAVAFVGKEMKDGKFTVFAHAAPTAEVKAYGIIFASNTYKENYDKQTDKGDMFTLKDTAAINKVNPSLKVSEVNVTTEGVVDFMATLNGCGGKVRHARAYVTYTNGTTVYSDVIVTNN